MPGAAYYAEQRAKEALQIASKKDLVRTPFRLL